MNDKTLSTLREQFESSNPVPFGVFWSEPDSRYMTNMVHLNCIEYQGKWLGWQSAVKNDPIDMIIFCPKCGLQHIDEPHGDWDNPPHKSHECQACFHIWRVADVPTNGVKTIKTVGKHDSALVEPASDGVEESFEYRLACLGSIDRCDVACGMYGDKFHQWGDAGPYVEYEDHLKHIDIYKDEVTRLQAELKQLGMVEYECRLALKVANQCNKQLVEQRDSMQAELTKAISLINRAHRSDGISPNCPLGVDLAEFLVHQSEPAAKDTTNEQ